MQDFITGFSIEIFNKGVEIHDTHLNIGQSPQLIISVIGSPIYKMTYIMVIHYAHILVYRFLREHYFKMSRKNQIFNLVIFILRNLSSTNQIANHKCSLKSVCPYETLQFVFYKNNNCLLCSFLKRLYHNYSGIITSRCLNLYRVYLYRYIFIDSI